MVDKSDLQILLLESRAPVHLDPNNLAVDQKESKLTGVGQCPAEEPVVVLEVQMRKVL